MIREERCEVTERYSVPEPYSLLQIGALLRNDGNDVGLLDMNGFDLEYQDLSDTIRSTHPDAVIFRFTPTTFDHDMRTASLAKEMDGGIQDHWNMLDTSSSIGSGNEGGSELRCVRDAGL